MNRKRVLIVDDEVMLTDILKENLEQTGQYEVRAETRGRWAMTAARSFQPDIIFLDVIMPDASGGDVAADLQKDAELKHIPIVFLTAILSRSEADNHGGIIAGHPFLAKPVTMQDIVKCIEQTTAKAKERLDTIET